MLGAPLAGRRVGFVGLGRMGLPMATRLLERGADLSVFNRTAARCTGLVERGAAALTSPAEVAHRSAVVISIVTDGEALRAVALGSEGVLAGAHPGLIFVDMSTVAPGDSEPVARAASLADVGYLRAPVMGTTPQAEAGTLGILASGRREHFEAVADVLGAFSATQRYVGTGEEARVLKLAINSMIGGIMASFAEAVVFAEKSGLEWQTILDAMFASPVGAPVLTFRQAGIESRTFPPGFTPGLLMKDLNLALGAAQAVGATMPMTALTSQLLLQMQRVGLAEMDVAGLVLLLERLGGMSPE